MKKVLIGISSILFLLIFSMYSFITCVYASMADDVSVPVQESDSSLFTIKDGILTKYTGNETTIVVPEGVTKIE